MKKYKRSSILLWVLALFAVCLLLPLAALGEELDVGMHLTADPENLFASKLAEMANSQIDEAVNGFLIDEVDIDRNYLVSTIFYQALEDAKITLRIYEDGEDGALLYTAGPVDAPADREVVVLQLKDLCPGISLPEYFYAEAEISDASGLSSTEPIYSYTEKTHFMENATAADFPDGHYVPLKAKPANGTGAMSGYVVYNSGLVVLPSGTPYSRGADGSVVFSPVPAALAGLSEDGLKNLHGVVVQGTQVLENDAFFLTDPEKGGFISGGSLTLYTRSDVSLQECYDYIHIRTDESRNATLNIPVPVSLLTDKASGTVTLKVVFDPDVDFDLLDLRFNFKLKLGLNGGFDLHVKRTTNMPDFNDPVNMARCEKMDVGSFQIAGAFGIGMYIDVGFRFAATGEADITGICKNEVSLSIGTSGVKTSAVSRVTFDSVVPSTPNEETFVFFGEAFAPSFKGFYFDFLFTKVGPVVSLDLPLVNGARALCIWEKDKPAGEDEIHTCCQRGEAGCISGKFGEQVSLSFSATIDLFVWDKTWSPSPILDKTEKEPNVTYFWHSLKYNEKNQKHGEEIICPFRLFRVPVKVLDYDDRGIPDISVSASPRRSANAPWADAKTDEEGKCNLYLSAELSPTRVRAKDNAGLEIGSEMTTPEKTKQHEEIIIRQQGRKIEKVDLRQNGTYFPQKSGDIIINYNLPGDPSRQAYIAYDVTGPEETAVSVIAAGWPTIDSGTSWSTARVGNGIYSATFRLSAPDGAFFVRELEATLLGKTFNNPDDPDAPLQPHFLVTGVSVTGSGRQADVTVKFIVGGGYYLLTIQDGAQACSRILYPAGSIAAAVSKDVSGIRDTLKAQVKEKVKEGPTSREKDALLSEINSMVDPPKPFLRWEVVEGGEAVSFPADFTGVTDELAGRFSYAGAFLIMPEKNVTLKAVYGDPNYIDRVDITVAEPVPGQEIRQPVSIPTEGIAPVDQSAVIWSSSYGLVTGKAEYNTEYRIKVHFALEDGYQFRFPLQMDEGTSAYFNGDKPAVSFGVDESGYYASCIFKTAGAQLLEVYQPDDLYFSYGTTLDVINTVLRRLNISIRTENPSVTSATAEWEPLTEVPGPGEQTDVNGTLIRPDGILNTQTETHDIVDESVKVTVHIYGRDKLAPPEANPAPGVYNQDVNVTLTTPEPDAGILYHLEGEEDWSEYTGKIPLKRGAETTIYHITAKTVKDDAETGKQLESEAVTFTYILQPKGGDHTLTIHGGTADCGDGDLSVQRVPAGTEVMVRADYADRLEGDRQEFHRWEINRGHIGDHDLTIPRLGFTMPDEDVELTAIYYPLPPYSSIMRIVMTVPEPVPGQPLAKKPTAVTMVYYAAYSEDEMDSDEFSLREVYFPDLVWLPADETVENGGTYTVSAVFNSWDLYKASGCPAWHFSTTVKGTVNGNPAETFTNAGTEDAGTDGHDEYASVTYTFKLPVQTYRVALDPNGGDPGTLPPAIVQVVEKDVTLPLEKPVHPDGYTFIGWAETPDATEPLYQPGDTYTRREDVTLYALWENNVINVTVYWEDSNNKDGIRPDQITVTLEKTDNPEADEPVWTDTGKTVTLSAPWAEENGVGVGHAVYTELESGTYRVRVSGVDENSHTISFGGNDRLYRVSYDDSHLDDHQQIIDMVAARIYTVEKDWDIDFENKDRPSSVKAVLQSSNVVRQDKSILELLWNLLSGKDDAAEELLTRLEQMTGVSLRGLSMDALKGKIAQMIITGDLSLSKLKDLIKPDGIDSDVNGTKWYGHQQIEVKGDDDWKASFQPVDRYIAKNRTQADDGTISVGEWGGEAKYRVREKGGKTIAENKDTLVFSVESYTSIVGKKVDAHKTRYLVTYSTSGTKTVIKNKAVQDHYIKKLWQTADGVKIPDSVYLAHLWKYDTDFVEAVESLIGETLPIKNIWLPELNPLAGDCMKLFDLIKVPISIGEASANASEAKNWRVYFRVNKYGIAGIPQKFKGQEAASAVINDLLVALGLPELPISFNPLQGFISVNSPPVSVLDSADLLSGILNIKLKWDDDDDDDPKTIRGAKVWQDGNDADHIRPDSVTLHLLEDGVMIKDIVVKPGADSALDAQGIWIWSYKDAKEGKKYTVTEDPVEDYTTEIDGLNVYNTHTPKKDDGITVKITKLWENDQPGNRPGELNVTLLQNGAEYQDVTLTAADGWTAEVKDAPPADEDGRLYDYSLLEKEIPEGYGASYSARWNETSRVWDLYVTNTAGQQKMLTVQKRWEDNGNARKLRPASVTVYLLADGEKVKTLTLTEDNGWAWTGERPEKTETGSVIAYTIQEEPVEGYTASYSGLTVTNTLPDDSEVPITIVKKWKGDTEAKRPVGLRVTLLRNGEAFGEPVVLTAGEGWTRYLGMFPLKDEHGNKYLYTAREETPYGYTAEYDISGGSAGWTITITNTKPGQDEVLLSGEKRWDDRNNMKGVRPDSVLFHILADGVETDVKLLNENNGWRWEGIYPEKNGKGETIVYSVREDPVPYYTAHYGFDGLSVTNVLTFPPEDEIALSLVKIWEGDTAADRPESLRVTVLQNGSPYGDPVILTADDGWAKPVGMVPVMDRNGNLYTYSAREEVPDGYTPSYQLNCSGSDWTITITNTKPKQEEVTIGGRKIWDDQNNALKRRPESVLFHILADGQEVGSKVLSRTSGWVWEGVYPEKNSEGKAIVYSVREDAIPGYTAKYSDDGLSVTNTLNVPPDPDPTLAKLTVRKVWKGDAEGDRPEKLRVTVLQNGAEYGSPLTLTAADGWKAAVGNLPMKDADGKQFLYSVREDVPDGYTEEYDVSWSQTAKEWTAVITNTKPGQEEVRLSGQKIWEDMDDFFGLRPALVLLHILADGEEADEKLLTEKTGWKWSGVYPEKNSEGRKITYTVREEPVPGYTAEYSADGLSVTNTLTGAPLTVTNTVLNGSPDRLFAYTLTLEDENGNPFEGVLPAEGTGEESVIRFTDGTASFKLQSGGSLTVQNVPAGWRYTLEQTPVEGYLTWVIDPDNELDPSAGKTDPREKGDHPDSTQGVIIALGNRADFYNDLGVTIRGRKTVDGKQPDPAEAVLFSFSLTDENHVSLQEAVCKEDGTFSFDLHTADQTQLNLYIMECDPGLGDLYLLDSDDHAVTVTISAGETEEEAAYTVEPEETVIDNKLNRTVVSGVKIWEDRNDRYKKRPESIVIRLMNGTAEVDSVTVTENEEGVWAYTFSDLPKYSTDGSLIRYTVKEDPVEFYETTYSGLNVVNTYHETPPPPPPGYPFVFHKVWKGSGSRPAPQFTLYNSDGTVRRSGKDQQPSRDKSDPTKYTYWLSDEDDYYVIEEPMKGFAVSYQNVKGSSHADETDRVYAYGTITNKRLPPTGDPAHLYLLSALCLLSGGTAVLLLTRRRRKKHH